MEKYIEIAKENELFLEMLSMEVKMTETIKKTSITSFGILLIIILTGLTFYFPSLGFSNEDKASLKILAQDDVFILMSNGVVIDKKRKLMWARTDNGSKISIEQAKVYVKAFKLAGHQDWRIPDIQELESLMVKNSPNNFTPTEGCSGDYQIHPFFQLTCCCPWALQDNGTRPAAFPFIQKVSGGSMWHHKSNSIGNRILPVRNME